MSVTAMVEISFERVNRFVVHKQHLSDDASTNDIVQIVKDIIGLHSTVATTPYLSLLARIDGFTRPQLDEELYVKRTLGKVRCMRKTVHILPREMIAIAYSATRGLVVPSSERYSRYLGISKEEYEKTAASILTILRVKAMSTSEIQELLAADLRVSPVVNLMCDEGLLIRGRPVKGWRSNIHTYQLFKDYFPGLDLDAVDEVKARELLVERYVASFGPVTENDVVWWLGLSKGEVRAALEQLESRMTHVDVNGAEGDYFMFASDLDSLESAEYKGGVVSLLPSLDPYLMGYKERERYLDYEYYERVFDRGGNATSTMLLDGRVVGVWDVAEKPEPTAKLLLFDDVEKEVLDDAFVVAKRIGKFILGREVGVKMCDSMVPLTRRTAGGVMTPLRDS